MSRTAALAVCTALLALAGGQTAALAQSGDPGEEFEGDEVEMEPDELPPPQGGTPSGAEENPEAPQILGQEAGRVEDEPPPEPVVYPRERVFRPITLHGGMGEVALDSRIGRRQLLGLGTGGASDTEALRASAELTARAGITDQVEIGLSYGIGALSEEDSTAGKAVAVEAIYRINDYIAAQLGVPMYFDPFAVGLTLGAPAKITIGDKLALTAGHDLVTINLHRFAPTTAEPAENEALAEAEAQNTVLPRGEVNVKLAALYQKSEALALGGEIGMRAVDFSTGDAPVPLFFLLSYSPVDAVDVGARLGFFNLDQATDNVGGSAFAAVRM